MISRRDAGWHACRYAARPDVDMTGWTVIIPVKQTTLAKSRLTGIVAPMRQRLAVAFALDTVTAALSASLVESVVVVTDDPVAVAVGRLGAVVVEDAPRSGINPALEYAAAQVRRCTPAADVAAISSDLPALRSGDLDRALGARELERWFVSDADRVGTTLIAATAGQEWTPAFGHRSRRAHLSAGMAELTGPKLDTLRRDVDTPDDLAVALGYGVGPHSAAVLDGLDGIARADALL